MSTATPNSGNVTQRNAPLLQSNSSFEKISEHVPSSNSASCCGCDTICQACSYFCRRIIFGPATFKIVVAFTIIVVGSLLKLMGISPSSYFSSKKNILNVYFAKLGWGWTIGLLVPFIYLTLIKFHSHYDILTRHLVRLLIATGVWFIITNLFVHIELYTGYCKNPTMKGLSKTLCIKGGHEWQIGHDFSGHTFLLLYAILIINEEIKSYDGYVKRINQISKVEEEVRNASLDMTNKYSKQIDILIKIFYGLLAALTVLWEFLLLSTALYFHHTSHKIIAGFLAVFFWFITYHMWFTNNGSSILRPLSPKEK